MSRKSPPHLNTPPLQPATAGSADAVPTKAVTVTDIAARAGVSIMTVSRAISGKGYVAEATRQKVMQAVESMGYVPNLGAKALKGGRTNVLGMLVSQFQSPVISAIITSVSRVVRENGLDMFIYDVGDHGSSAQRNDMMPLLNSLCDGMLLILPGHYQDHIAKFQRSERPTVLLNYWRSATDLPVVRADNYWGALAVTEHLIEHGHRRIAFIQGTESSGQSAERERGYTDALLKAGIKLDPQLVVPGDFNLVSGRVQALALLKGKQPPTAIFAANDVMAIGAQEAAESLGLSVPGDLSIAGFDDIGVAQQGHPALTTVRQDYEQLGESAVHLLLQQIAHGVRRGIRVELESKLIVRTSTGPAPTARAAARRPSRASQASQATGKARSR